MRRLRLTGSWYPKPETLPDHGERPGPNTVPKDNGDGATENRSRETERPDAMRDALRRASPTWNVSSAVTSARKRLRQYAAATDKNFKRLKSDEQTKYLEVHPYSEHWPDSKKEQQYRAQRKRKTRGLDDGKPGPKMNKPTKPAKSADPKHYQHKPNKAASRNHPKKPNRPIGVR